MFGGGLLAVRPEVVSANHPDPVRWLGFALLAGAALSCLYATVLNLMHKRHDMDDQKLGILTEVLKFLEVDLPAKSKLAARLALLEPRYCLQRSFAGFQQHIEAFDDPWLDLQGRLADGTAFRVKASSVGKKKIKIKRKGRIRVSGPRHKSRVDLAIQPAPGRYPGLDGLPGSVPRSVEGEGSGKVTKLTHESGRLVATIRYHGALDAGRVLRSLVWLFRGLKMVKAQAMQVDVGP